MILIYQKHIQIRQIKYIIKMDFHLRLQNTENFALNASSSWCNILNLFCKLFHTDGAKKEIHSADYSWFSLVVHLVL